MRRDELDTTLPPEILGLVSFPNPFDRSMWISYALAGRAGDSNVRLTIHDPAGRLVRTLVDAEQPPGRCSVLWDARGHSGEAVATGPYFCRLQVDGERRTTRVVPARYDPDIRRLSGL